MGSSIALQDVVCSINEGRFFVRRVFFLSSLPDPFRLVKAAGGIIGGVRYRLSECGLFCKEREVFCP